MPDDAEEQLEPFYDPDRRLAMFFKLIEEGLIANKLPEQIAAADLHLVDSRLLLEDAAASDGVSVDTMIDGWERELATARSFDSVEDVMRWLNDDPASEPRK